MLSLSAIAKSEKNKMSTDGVFVLLLELRIPMDDVDPIYVCRNTEDITWNGKTWQAFPFEIGKVQKINPAAFRLLKSASITRARH